MIASFRMRASMLLQWFRRPRVTVSLIVILLALYTLGLVVPQKIFFEGRQHYEEWVASYGFLGRLLDLLGFTDIYASPVTILFLTLFYANLLLVVAQRVPVILRKAYLRDREGAVSFGKEAVQRSEQRREIALPGTDARKAGDRVADFFRGRGWFVMQSGERDRTLAVRNRFSAVGFLLFHLSFLFCLTGGLAIHYTRFSGKIALTEGEAFEGDLQQFSVISRQPKLLRELPSLSFRLDQARFEYEGRQPSHLEALMSIRFEEDETQERIAVNDPLVRGAYTILPLEVGVSPLVVVSETGTGRDLDGAWVRLASTDEQEDTFRFEVMDGIILHARFYADHVREKGVERTRSLNIRNPAFHIVARKDEKVLAEQTLFRGQTMVIGPYDVQFRDLRRWISFQVVREMGAGPLVLGFVLGITGLVMRLIFFRRELRIVLAGERLWLDGKSEYYQHSFAEELDGLADALRKHLQDGGSGEVAGP